MINERLAEKLKLQETIFDYPYEASVEVRGKYYDPLLVLEEACPGNVTARFNSRGDFEWIPINAPTGLIDCNRIFTFWDESRGLKHFSSFRPRERKILDVLYKSDSEIFLLKVKFIGGLERFANARSRASDRWGYCKDCNRVDQKFNHKNHDFKNLRVDTQSSPFIIKFLEPPPQGLPKKFPIWLQELSSGIVFFDRYNQQLSLYEGAIGVLATWKLLGESSLINEFYGFQYKNKPAAVGYEYYTEGFKVSINLNKLMSKLKEFLETFKDNYFILNLYVKFLIYNLTYSLIKEKISPFDAEFISKLLISKFSFNFIEDTNKIIEEMYLSRIHPITKEKIKSFMESKKFDEYEDFVKKSLKNINKSEYLEYLMYTFIHSLSHSFLIASSSCGGVGENELDEYIKFNGNTADLFIYEKPLNGATRIIERSLIHKPGNGRTVDFLYYLENSMLSCPIGEAEEFMYDVIFRLSKSRINEVKDLLKKLEARNISLEEFLLHLSIITQCSVPSNMVLLEKLRKSSYTSLIKEKELDEFNLYFEIYMLYLYLKQKLKREPFLEEFIWTVENIDKIDTLDLISSLAQENLDEELLKERISFSELMQLKNLLGDPKLFFEEVQKRYLRSCVDGCPSCIGILCREDIWGLSRYSVSRVLLQKLVLDSIKSDVSIVSSLDEKLLSEWVNRLKDRGFIFLASLQQYKCELSNLISKMIQQGGSIRDFRVMKMGDNKYYFLALMVI